MGKLKRDDVALLKKNSVYRVADVVYRRGKRWREDTKTIIKNPAFKNTILFDYLTEKRHERDFKTFGKIVHRHSEKNQYRLADPTHLVVHMRLGDVMTMYRQRDCRTIYSNFYKRVNITDLPISNVTLVTAFHFGHNDIHKKYFYNTTAIKKSWNIVKDFERQTHDAGLKLELFSNENVDEDICFMASSRFFVKGSTALSTIIASCLGKDSQVWG